MIKIYWLVKKVLSFWTKHRLFKRECLSVLIFVGAYSTIIYADESTTVRGDSSQLPKVDYSKTVEIKSFGGFNRAFETKSLEVQEVHLPTYSGDLKSLPLVEWQAPKKDFYTKSLTLPDLEIKFETKNASEKWSQQISLKGEPVLRKADSYFDGKQADLPSSPIEKKDLETPRNITGEELKQLINQGTRGTAVEVAPVKMGHEFGKTQQNEKAKEIPETKSLPKSEPSK